MKNFINLIRLIVVLMVSLQTGSAQSWVWKKAFGIDGWSEGNSITTDIDGNVYSVGAYSDSIVFDQFQLDTLNGSYAFLLKQRSDGTIIWVQGESNIYPEQVCYNQGNIYMAGQAFGISTIGGQTFSNGPARAFLAKLDTAGNSIWINNDISYNDMHINDITVDGFSNTIITGWFNSDLIVNSDTTYSCSKDVFIVKYDSIGNIAWYKTIISCGKDGGMGVATDSYGDVYFTGSAYGSSLDSIWLDNLYLLTPNAYYVGKISSSGNPIWFQGDSMSIGSDISINESDEIFVAGFFGETAYFGNDTISSIYVDQFVNKMDINGNVIWSKKLSECLDTTSLCAPLKIECNEGGGFSILNWFYGSYDFSGSVYNVPDSISAYSVQKFDDNGNQLFVKPMFGNIQNQKDIAVDDFNNIYITGYYGAVGHPGTEYLTFDADTFFSLEGMHIIIAKLSNDSTVSIENIYSNNELITYPNPTQAYLWVRSDIQSIGTVEIIDMDGNIVFTQKTTIGSNIFDISYFNSGVYIFRFSNSEIILNKKIIKTN